MYLKTSSAKWRPFCPGGDELMSQGIINYGIDVAIREYSGLYTIHCLCCYKGIMRQDSVA